MWVGLIGDPSQKGPTHDEAHGAAGALRDALLPIAIEQIGLI